MNKAEVSSILNKTKRRDPWFLDDYTINPYSGCSFNCLYCYIRGSKYGIHMEKKLSVKSNALELLDKQLHSRAKKKQYGIIVLSSATDPYLQFEHEEGPIAIGLSRGILEIILQHRFPVHIITKSPLVRRDFDLLKKIREVAILPAELEGKLPQKAFLTFSFSTLRDEVAKIFEPGAPAPALRMEALKEAVNEGLLAGVSLMPLLPYISDTTAELDHFFSTFKEAGAAYIFPAGLSLFGYGLSDSRTLVMKAIQKHYPELLPKYEKLFVNGRLPDYYASAFRRKAKQLCRDYGIPDRIDLQ